jgi:hypothetical protein
MPDPWSITITPVPGSEDCLIKTSDGQEFSVRGAAIFADGGDGHLFAWYWNSPGMAASGFVRSLSESIRSGNTFAEQFYRAILRGLTMATGGKDKKYVSVDDVLRRWEAEETYQAVTEDPKKFN